MTPELAAIEEIPTTDPRGNDPGGPGTGIGAGPGGDAGPGGAVPPGGRSERAGRVSIHAVIVSAAQSPWDAITKAPGVRNVIVTGGIIALGKTPIAGEISGGGPQPAWLRLIPDLRLLNGSAIPPVVPNVIRYPDLELPDKGCRVRLREVNIYLGKVTVMKKMRFPVGFDHYDRCCDAGCACWVGSSRYSGQSCLMLPTAYGGPVEREKERALEVARRKYGPDVRILASSDVTGYGAIAVAHPANGRGSIIGVALGMRSATEANTVAIEKCLKAGGVNPQVKWAFRG